MKVCQFCQGKIPLINSGKLLLNIYDYSVADRLKERLEKVDKNIVLDGSWLQINYVSWDSLQRYMSLVQSLLSDRELEAFSGSLHGDFQGSYCRYEAPLSRLSLIIENPLFVKIIQEKLFQSYMQPIIEVKNGCRYGYEFLLRPNSKVYPFSPGELFMFAQHAGLQSALDSQSRINAIRTGAQMLSRGSKLFINFLPSSIYDPAHCLKSTFEAVESYGVVPEDLVFEVVETEKVHDVEHLKAIFDTYQKAGVKVALDDIGAGYSTIELLKELRPDYAKIDRGLIRDCDSDSEKMERIKYLRTLTKSMGIKLLAEGVETKEEFEVVRDYVDLVQGYLFGKPLKKPA